MGCAFACGQASLFVLAIFQCLRGKRNYYPKLQGCVPFTPATGPRLLAKDKDAKTGLISTMVQACHDWGYSGVHLTFLQDEDLSLLKDVGFAHREDRQFHFVNRGYDSFDDFGLI